jgi:predicted O-methyltransferase YrrM
MIDLPEPPKIIHHEANIHKIVSKQYDMREDVKLKAYQAMSELDGWCSEEKASILIDFVFLLNAQTIVEIGVFGGKSLIPMAFAIKELGNGKVYGIDPWTSAASVEGMDGANKEWWGKLNHDAILKKLRTKIAQFDLQKQIQLIRKTSVNAPAIMDIDILHIDGNHSDEASMIDVNKWVPLVRKGGLIFFDDINWNNAGLAVEWLDEHCIRFVHFTGDNEWGIWIKP